MEVKTIKVEVPKCYTAKYDTATQTIKIVPEDYTVIKDFETACQVLGINSAIPTEIQANEQLCAIYKMQIVLKAVNRDLTFNLINGKVWYPMVRFIDKKIVDEEIMLNSEFKVLDFTYENNIFTLVGGLTYYGSQAGISYFSPFRSVGSSNASMGLFACCTESIAHHVSKYFAALIFDCCFTGKLGFSLSNGEKVIKNYPILD